MNRNFALLTRDLFPPPFHLSPLFISTLRSAVGTTGLVHYWKISGDIPSVFMICPTLDDPKPKFPVFFFCLGDSFFWARDLCIAFELIPQNAEEEFYGVSLCPSALNFPQSYCDWRNNRSCNSGVDSSTTGNVSPFFFTRGDGGGDKKSPSLLDCQRSFTFMASAERIDCK